jgi:hypothetical protein
MLIHGTGKKKVCLFLSNNETQCFESVSYKRNDVGQLR